MNTIKQQKYNHIYLTNACCESTDHFNEAHFKELGLEYGWWTGGKVIEAVECGTGNQYEFYPLTPTEAHLITSRGFFTGEGYVGLTGYSTLFDNQKWLTPTIEIEWPTEDKARYGYGLEEMHRPSMVEAYLLAIQLAARATIRLERIGGYAELEESLQNAYDRFTVALHIPMDWAVKQFMDYDEYCAFLHGVML